MRIPKSKYGKKGDISAKKKKKKKNLGITKLVRFKQ